MFCVEILDDNESVISTHKVKDGLTLLGQSTGAHIPLRGKGIGGLHVGIKVNPKTKQLSVMDLGGPTPIKVDGKVVIEKDFSNESSSQTTTLEIGSRKIRIRKIKDVLSDIRSTKWSPITDLASLKENGFKTDKSLTTRIRIYIKGQAHDIITTKNDFYLGAEFGLSEKRKFIFKKAGLIMAQIPSEWIAFGGRVQAGDKIEKLNDWNQPVELKENTIYRIFSGPYLAEILITNGQVILAGNSTGNRLDFFPKELRKPFAISLLSILALMTLWNMDSEKKKEVEEPYPVYARIQNIPVEKILEPEPSEMPAAGGGSGSQSNQNTAPTSGAAASPSKLAQNLTGGLKNLFGNVLSQSKNTNNAVVAENGLGQTAHVSGGGGAPSTSKLASVGMTQGNTNISGSSKLGNLALAGSGKGFGGGSGTGLGTGSGTGIGSGVGDGIGKGGFRLVEEESFVDGGLDKSVIAAVIQNNLNQIKYCYERQLVAEPDLFGKVVVLWTINASGTVEGPSIKQTTLNSKPVEQCMLSKISGWKFPQPKNGTKVSVSYPFLFKSTK